MDGMFEDPPAMAEPQMDLGGDFAAPDAAGATDAAAFMTGEAASGYSDPFQGMPVQESASAGMAVPETATALREWEDKHERELQDAARQEEGKKNDRRQSASEALSRWYQERDANRQKRLATNRADEQSSEAARVDMVSPTANPWERVVDLIDTNAKTADGCRDTGRMRALLIQLKSSPLVPAN
mmetsp:Transcript_110840/g.309763  ORF Transcript_110840/g.309763 Transcript_110840/m.309763 type:complete len:184 (+) Transcript_110840:65-616(+)